MMKSVNFCDFHRPSRYPLTARTQWLFKSTDRLPQCATVVLGMRWNLIIIDNFRGVSEEDRGRGGERRRYRTVVNCSNSYRYERYSYTVEPVYNGPLLSSQFLKSRFFVHTDALFVTCIKRPPLLSGHGHPVAVLCLSFFVIFTCFKRPPLNGN